MSAKESLSALTLMAEDESFLSLSQKGTISDEEAIFGGDKAFFIIRQYPLTIPLKTKDTIIITDIVNWYHGCIGAVCLKPNKGVVKNPDQFEIVKNMNEPIMKPIPDNIDEPTEKEFAAPKVLSSTNKQLAGYLLKISRHYENENIGIFDNLGMNEIIVSDECEAIEYIDLRLCEMFSTIAYAAMADGEFELKISDGDSFVLAIRHSIYRGIPVDPNDLSDFLSCLIGELKRSIIENQFENEWGSLIIRNNSIYLKVKNNPSQIVQYDEHTSEMLLLDYE